VLLVSHDRALLDAVAERTLAIEDGELHGYDGGWAEMLRRREERAARATAPAPKAEKPAKPKPKPAPKKRRPSELERIETEIAAREAEVARLEAKLAEDWSDVDVLAAHKRSRDALTALLTRWETLFEAASPRPGRD
jgi:ATP-binding cassette subfamily F protein uup